MKRALPKLFCILLAIAGLCIAGCSGGNSTQNKSSFHRKTEFRLDDSPQFRAGWSKENSLIYHISGEPPTLHPTNANSSGWMEISRYIHGFLNYQDFENQDIAAGIVSLPESPDGIHYSYTIRDGVRWDDNTPLTFEDILFTLKVILCPLTNNAFVKPFLENLQDVIPDQKDSMKFMLLMNAPYIQSRSLLMDVLILERKFFDPRNLLGNYSIHDFTQASFSPGADLVKWASEFNDDKYGRDVKLINGIGPYKLVSWDPGQSLTLQRKANYWYAGKPNPYFNAYPEKITFRLNRDDVSQLMEFRTQVMDASTGISLKSFMTLGNDSIVRSNYHLALMPTYNYVYMGMNQKPDGLQHKKILDDVRVRRAIALLTPVEEIIRLIYKEYRDQCSRVSGPVVPLKKEFDTTLALVSFDPELAKKILADAGWSDTDGDQVRDKIIHGEKIGLRLGLQILNNTADWKDMASLILESCRKAGISLEVISLDPKVFHEKARYHDFDLMLGTMTGNSQPEDFAQIWGTSSWVSNGSNYSGFGNASSDALIDSIKVTLDPSARASMIKRLQRIIYDDQPVVFLYNNLRRNIIHKRFYNASVYAERPGMLLNNLRLGFPNKVNP